MSKLSIKEWAEEDRPREKLLLKGASSLTNAELIAILIGSGNSEETAVELSRRILSTNNNDLNTLAKKDVYDLTQKYKGIGEAKAVSIIAALELGRRRKTEVVEEKRKITSSRIAYEEFVPMLTDLNYEEIWALFTDRSNKVIKSKRISSGGISESTIDVRLVLREAINCYASGIFLGHNHPSENCRPSRMDEQITKKLKEAARLMDITLVDHIIVCGNNYYSFADNGFF